MTGIVFDIDHFAVHDGPGIRTAVYLKGCPGHCSWCHSPESQQMQPEVVRVLDQCSGCGRCHECCPVSRRRGDCLRCGRCTAGCPNQALRWCGETMSVDAVVAEAAADAVFFRHSGGGVTLTGGEVLVQADFALAILQALKGQGIHTVVETAGMGSWDALAALIPFVDLFYYDLKLMDEATYQEHIGSSFDQVQINLQRLSQAAAEVVLRVPLFPGLTDTTDNVEAIYRKAVELGISTVHLLPYNVSAGAKYEWIGRTYPLGTLESQSVDQVAYLTGMAPDSLDVVVSHG